MKSNTNDMALQNKNSKVDNLIYLRDTEQFNLSNYFDARLEELGKIPSLLSEIVSNLIAQLNTRNDGKKLKQILKDGLEKFNEDIVSDTEDRENICEIFSEIAALVDVKLSNDLNIWLYGEFLGRAIILQKVLKGPETIKRRTFNDCKGCNVKLETLILKESISSSSYWLIVRCNNCRSYNIIPMADNAKMTRSGNYKIIDYLYKVEYTEEQAWLRIEQLQAFGKLP